MAEGEASRCRAVANSRPLRAQLGATVSPAPACIPPFPKPAPFWPLPQPAVRPAMPCHAYLLLLCEVLPRRNILQRAAAPLVPALSSVVARTPHLAEQVQYLQGGVSGAGQFRAMQRRVTGRSQVGWQGRHDCAGQLMPRFRARGWAEEQSSLLWEAYAAAYHCWQAGTSRQMLHTKA